MNEMNFTKATMYYRNDFGGMSKVEVKEISIEVRPCAQYNAAVHVAYKAPRQRHSRRFVQHSYPSLLVLEGWGHPDPGSMYGAPEAVGGGVTLQRSKYLSCDPRYQQDFDAQIGAYLGESGSSVLADFRNHRAG